LAQEHPLSDQQGPLAHLVALQAQLAHLVVQEQQGLEQAVRLAQQGQLVQAD
jgi:hypothetical protein